MIKHHGSKKHAHAREQWSSQKVFDATHEFVTSQIHFTKSWQPTVVTLWAMGTYLHRKFPCYGHLWLNSPTTHSGKSKLLSVLWSVCYKAMSPQLEPTAAVLFRFPSTIGGTLLIDEVDKLDPKRKSEVIGILNHYHKTGSVLRAERGKNGKYSLREYPIYCPKVIAGIENLPVTLQDRCVRIALHRKRHDEKVDRFMPEDYSRMEPLREQLKAWASRKASAIVAALHKRDHLKVPHEVHDDRVRDIVEPLFAIASVLPRSVREELAEGTLEIAKGRKAEEQESNPVVAGIRILVSKFPEGEDVWKLRSVTACRLLEEVPGLEDRAKVQTFLRKLGFTSKNCKIDKKVLRAYRIPRKSLERLAGRYR
jgi:hypothetical protein